MDTIAKRKWGPITATLTLEDDNNVTVSGLFYDDGREKSYPGPHFVVSHPSEELLAIVKDSPALYLRSRQWREYIRDLWVTVQDNSWFRYT